MKEKICDGVSAGVQWMITTIALLLSASGAYVEMRQVREFIISERVFIIIGLIGALIGVIWTIYREDGDIEMRVVNRIDYIILILIWPIIYGGLLILLAVLGLQNTLVMRYSPVNEILLFSGGVIFSFIVVYVIEIELINSLSRD